MTIRPQRISPKIKVAHCMQVISVDVPNQLTLEVTETAPGVKGNTVSGGTKAATLETGAVIQVSLSAAAGPLLTDLSYH